MVTRFMAIGLLGLALAGCAHVQTARLGASTGERWTAPLSSGALAVAEQRCSQVNQVGRVEGIDPQARTMTLACVAPGA
jgi:hypothetical protein